ncbi:MAG: carboxypeptidase-like regulatory domain-containing protein [Bernardetiaceae bacterium]|nr:carboxypeptidase-like regulatory domain-containing protein [Bernardetiaceae bacterium]
MYKKILFTAMAFALTLSMAWAQRTVSGRVLSEDGNTPLPGVTVQVKGTTTGTQTDLDGRYNLSVGENAKVGGNTNKTVTENEYHRFF